MRSERKLAHLDTGQGVLVVAEVDHLAPVPPVESRRPGFMCCNLVLETNGVMRHVRLKASFKGSTVTKTQVNTALAVDAHRKLTSGAR